jgi:hypothetical protein
MIMRTARFGKLSAAFADWIAQTERAAAQRVAVRDRFMAKLR